MFKMKISETKAWEKVKKHKTLLKWSLTILLVLLMLLILLCQVTCSGRKWKFKSREDALEAYYDYLDGVRKMKKTDTEEFGELLYEWQELTDTVFKRLDKDSTFNVYHNEAYKFWQTHDSIKSQMLRLTESWKYGYEDIYIIRDKSCPFKNDSVLVRAVREAEPFYQLLDREGISSSDIQSVLMKYRFFLQETKKAGIHNREQMLGFIGKEDFMFRSFLAHLYEIDKEPLADITRDTEAICLQIFTAAREGKIPVKDAVVFMHMRATRRLLQNAEVCVNDINRQTMKSQTQANAYLWMIIQPFISINQFAFATMSEHDRAVFVSLTKQLPQTKRFAETFHVDLAELNYLLPQQLLKLYVLSL